MHRLLSLGTVAIQSIYGALSAYLMIGLMFAAFFAATASLAARSFLASGAPVNTRTLQYFGFTTLTTLGYGDFTAVGNVGRAVAVLEALIGQIFLATLVARLVAAFRAPGEGRNERLSTFRARGPATGAGSGRPSKGCAAGVLGRVLGRPASALS